MDWYTRQRAEMFEQQGTDDDFFAEYPETPEQALAPETLIGGWPMNGWRRVLWKGRAAARAAPYGGVMTMRPLCPAW